MKKLIELYVYANLHVAFAAMSMVVITGQLLNCVLGAELPIFVFVLTFMGYTYTRGNLYLFNKNTSIIILLGMLVVFCPIFIYRILNPISYGLIFLTILLTMFYLTPYSQRGLRNIPRIKIYIVSLCWVLITHLLPVIEVGYPIDNQMLILGIQRFVLVVLLLLVFDIVDLHQDEQKLQTVPHQLGVYRTKVIAIILLVVSFVLLLFVNSDFYKILINSMMSIVLLFFILFSSPFKSKMYTLFWLEAVPIVWALLLLI
ncbi:MAG: hypothetical protein Q4B43_03695 [Bacteroidota bacterium]|nr:hypothetical protein [Bacteroidota bacterium]